VGGQCGGRAGQCGFCCAAGAGQPAALAAKGGMAAVRFEPMPVILGTPELPLMGSGARQASTAWTDGLNYQGLHVSYVLLDAKGRQTGLWPLSKPLPAGQRFRIRITPSFDGVAGIDRCWARCGMPSAPVRCIPMQGCRLN
jgi:hypothetical protein